jgi:hypothetical protein
LSASSPTSPSSLVVEKDDSGDIGGPLNGDENDDDDTAKSARGPGAGQLEASSFEGW